MPKWLKIVLLVIGSLFVIISICFFIIIKSIEPKIPKLKSDVKIIYKIGWWSHQEALNVKNFEAIILYDTLNLFNSKSIIEYRISGTLTSKKGWKPYISSVFLSERWVNSPLNYSGNQGEIVAIPIVKVKEVDNYNGETVPFAIKVQDYLNTGGWGVNIYTVKCQSFKTKIELHQTK